MSELVSDKEKHQFIEERDVWTEHKRFNPLFQDFVDRIDRDDDVIVPLGGQRRSGKSTLGCESALYGNPKWTPWEYLVFTIKEILEKVEYASKGTAIFWDEIGTDYNAYRFMTTESIAVTNMLEMVGDKNLLLVFTAPSFKSFAKGGRKNVTHYISVRRYEGDKRGYARAFKIWLDDWDNKIGRYHMCDFFFHRLPSRMYEVYDKYKRNYLKDVISKSREMIFLKGLKDILPYRVYDVFYVLYLNAHNGGLRSGELNEIFPESTVSYALKILNGQNLIIKKNMKHIINPDVLPSSKSPKSLI